MTESGDTSDFTDPTYVSDQDDVEAAEELAETDWSPPDREPAAMRHTGWTESEALAGESLDERLSEEEPDVGSGDLGGDELSPDTGDQPADPRAGRLVAPDEGLGVDDEPEEVATDAGFAGYASSAEEAAVHVIDPTADAPDSDDDSPDADV
jgi:hypothetical protein